MVYADLRWKNQGLKGQFTDPSWVTEYAKRMAAYSLVVICSPPYEEVERIMQAQGRDAHMPLACSRAGTQLDGSDTVNIALASRYGDPV